MVEVKRIRNGEHQTLETLINEEAQLFEVPPRRGQGVDSASFVVVTMSRARRYGLVSVCVSSFLVLCFLEKYIKKKGMVQVLLYRVAHHFE